MKNNNLASFHKDLTKIRYFCGEGEFKEVDIQGLEIPVYEGSIRSGGGDACTIMANSIIAIGNTDKHCSLPFSVYAHEYNNTFKIYSTNNEEDINYSSVKNFISDSIHNQNYESIALPIDAYGHASLAVFQVNHKQQNIEILFFDSMPTDDSKRSDRYGRLIPNISNLIESDTYKLVKSSFIQSDKIYPSSNGDYTVLNLLHQGGEDSVGCGFYTPYTAMLIRDNGIQNLVEASKKDYLLNEKDETLIKQHLIVLTMAAYGPENISKRECRRGRFSFSHFFSALKTDIPEFRDNLLKRTAPEIALKESDPREIARQEAEDRELDRQELKAMRRSYNLPSSSSSHSSDESSYSRSSSSSSRSSDSSEESWGERFPRGGKNLEF